ncbi:MAG: tail fiber domain-containing protein [SAR86 cluster bacterium]|tara:strand:+ start:6237 stop:7994 length:1758 start_codon:yes stop_codon:yes gene_type:complete
MASSYTTNITLEKPTPGEQSGEWGTTLNANFDKIDTKLAIKDEDNMASDSASHLATQQSIKAYVDSQVNTEETIEDFVGGMVTGNTETGIAVTYEDSDGTLDFVVSDTTVAGDSGSTGITPGDTLTIAGGTNVTTAMSGDTLTVTSTDTNTQLTQEQVEDFVGGMVTGNTETGITVTYQDADGTLDFEVSGATALAADDLTEGDAAVTLSTSSGNITIDATANDSDIIFKGTDNTSDITMLTLDGSEAGAATFNDKIIATELDISGDIDVDGTANLDIVDIDGAVDMASTLAVAGAYTGGGLMTTGGNIVIPDSGYVGSATTTTAMHILGSGEVGIGASAYTGAQLYSYDNGTGSIGLRVHLDNALGTQMGAYITTDGGGAALTGHTNGAHYGLYGLSGVSGSSPSTGYYGIYGKTFHPSYGGVLGYNAAGDKYGILGYSTTHAMYGVGLVYSSGAATHSDIRLKDIQSRISVSDGILAKINQLQPTYFKWKPESEQGKGVSDEQIGLIAQEVELIFPHLVDENDVPQHDDLSGEDTREKTLNEELGSTKVVAYEKLACYLTSAIQELSAKNDALEARIATLESG